MNTITCPHCHKSFELNEVLTHQIEEELLAGEQKKHEEEIGAVKHTVEEGQVKARKQVVDFLVAQVVGTDEELKKKLDSIEMTINNTNETVYAIQIKLDGDFSV